MQVVIWWLWWQGFHNVNFVLSNTAIKQSGKREMSSKVATCSLSEMMLRLAGTETCCGAARRILP